MTLRHMRRRTRNGRPEVGLQFYDLVIPGDMTRRCGPISRTSRSSASTTTRSRASSRSRSRPSCTAPRTPTRPPTWSRAPRFIDEVPLSLLLRHRRRRLDPEGEVGGHHRRGPRERTTRDPPGRHRDRQHRLASLLGRQPRKYFVESPGTYKEAGEWLRDRGVKGFGIDCQALDHPLGTAIGPQPNGPLIPAIARGVRGAHRPDARTMTSRDWEPCHRALLGNGIVGFENVGGQIDEVTGKRVTFAAFPWRWTRATAASCGWSRSLDPSGRLPDRDRRE